MWFEDITGFIEKTPRQVRQNLTVDGGVLRSHVNGKKFTCGSLEIPCLSDLRQRVRESLIKTGKISLREVIGNVQDLHADISNAGALFQVASQFNLLEMPGPSITPEHGVAGYENDHTQGPACAVAAGAGTIYRNYFADVNGEIGQSADNQIDCLAGIGEALGNIDECLWKMQNGYALASEGGLIEIENHLTSLVETDIDKLRGLLRLGIQWNTEVTISASKQIVSQAYCSALPVAYSDYSASLWEEFARMILEASYEATVCTGILNYLKTGNNKLFLTLIGGGAFGNDIDWIIEAIRRALEIYKDTSLDVVIVSYGASNERVQRLINQFA